MAGDKTRKLTLLAEVDQKAIQQGISLLGKERNAVMGVVDAEEQQAKARREYAATLGALENQTRLSVNTARSRADAIREEIKYIAQLEQQVKDLQKAEESEARTPTARTGSRNNEAISATGRGLQTLAQVVPGAGGDALRGAADISKLIERWPEFIDGLKGLGAAETVATTATEGATLSIGGLTAALGPIALVAAAAAAAMVVYGEVIKAGQERAQAVIDAEKQIAELRITGSQQEVQAAIEAAQTKMRIIQVEQEFYKRQLAETPQVGARAIIEGQGPLQAAFGQLLAVVGAGEYVGAIRDNNAEYQKQQILLEELEKLQGQYNASLEKTGKITGDVLAAEQRAEAARESAAQRHEQATSKMEQLQEAQAGYAESIADLEEQLGEDRLRIAKQTADSIAAIEKRLADKQDAIREEYAKVEAEIADIVAEQGERETELRQQTEKKINKVVEDAADERARILADYEEEAQDAVLNRDADALVRAERTRDKRLTEAEKQLQEQVKAEKEALEERIKEGRKADEKRLQDLRTAYGQEASDRQNSLNQKLNDLRAAADAEIALTRQKEQEQISELNARYADQMTALNRHYAQQIETITGHHTKVEELTKEHLETIAQQWIATYNQIIADTGPAASSGGTSGGSGGTNPSTPYTASGIQSAPGGWRWFGESGPELAYIPRGSDVYSHARSQQMMGGANFNGNLTLQFNVPGGAQIDTQQLMDQVRREAPNLVAQGLAQLAGMDA